MGFFFNSNSPNFNLHLLNKLTVTRTFQRWIALVLVVIPLSTFCQEPKEVTISGYLTESVSGEVLIGATVYIPSIGKGGYTNEYGFWSFTVPPGTYELNFKYIGYDPDSRTVHASRDTTINIELGGVGTKVETVQIVAEDLEEKEAIQSTQMGAIKIRPKEVSMVPSLGGETDVIKVMQLMPGISQGGEGTTGMFVRGGDADQNLVLLDEAVVYNTGHLFGFFSVFNPDAINDMTIVKGGFPANYGGRLSSVLDIRMKEGNQEEFHFKGGVGLLSSRLTVESPIIKDKMSFMISGRRTYIDQVLKTVKVNVPYYFYDINAKINYKISDNDRLYLSSYFGYDILKVNENVESEDSSGTGELLNFGFRLGNFTQTARWNHLFSHKMFANFTAIHTTFNYDINGSFLNNSILIKSRIRDLGGKADFSYFANPKTTVKFGGTAVNHAFRPNIVSTSGQISGFLDSRSGQLINSQEVGLYGNADFEVSERVKLNTGMRLSGSITNDGTFYPGAEPRVSSRYLITEYNSIKASYSRMYQYMHRVSSSTVAMPTDLWYPVTKRVRPQIADQVAVGYNHFVPKLKTMVTIEAYYKNLQNLIEYREGANLILNDNFEDELVNGNGNSYGAEVLLRRQKGKLTGWIGYTLSWSTRKFPDLNEGDRYFAKYDRRHDISVVTMYEVSKRFALSGVWIYNSGSRFTAQTGQYFMPNASLTGVDVIPVYSKRNAVKMAPTHRLDLNFVFKSKEENKQGNPRRFKWEWHVGAYNVYNRAAPFRINIEASENGYKYTQPGLFGFLPFVAFNFDY